ncbi:hypothetical protein C8R43DRAFT_1120392 [Mycena crocata]|nr:hypothetical protein C8R43DRAFT_1120392 [Mycena crocata]
MTDLNAAAQEPSSAQAVLLPPPGFAVPPPSQHGYYTFVPYPPVATAPAANADASQPAASAGPPSPAVAPTQVAPVPQGLPLTAVVSIPNPHIVTGIPPGLASLLHWTAPWVANVIYSVAPDGLLPPLLLSSMNPFPAPAPSHALATPPDHLSDLPPLVGPVYAAHDGITLSRFQTQADFQAAFNAASREYEALLGNQQGHTHAQTIEALWAACNPEQPPSHIMGIGQRHDAIDRSVLLACCARASRRPHVFRTHPR